MIDITSKIKEMTTIYDELINIAQESFEHLKTKEFNQQKNDQENENACFSKLLQKKEEVSGILQEEANDKKADIGKVQDMYQFLGDTEKSHLQHWINQMTQKEKELRRQLNLNIEMANVIRETHAIRINAAFDVIKDENEKNGDSGPFLLNEDY